MCELKSSMHNFYWIIIIGKQNKKNYVFQAYSVIILPLESGQKETSELLDEDKIISRYITFNISFASNLSDGNFLILSLCL